MFTHRDRLVTQLCSLFGWVACQCCLLAPRWHHYGWASLPPEWCHGLFISGVSNTTPIKHWPKTNVSNIGRLLIRYQPHKKTGASVIKLPQ